MQNTFTVGNKFLDHNRQKWILFSLGAVNSIFHRSALYASSLYDTLLLYNWLADNTFASELKAKLNTAKTNLQAEDSLACRVQVKAFQDLVDNVYKDSLNTDARFVTIEGWKFLYWNAQYILDRLPVDAYKKE
jgi:hypothetical protein